MKAQNNAWVFILLTVIAILLITGLANSLLAKMKETNEYQACKVSIRIASASTKVTGDRKIILPCKRHSLVFADEDERAIKKAIADRIYKCATMTGEGKLDWEGAPWFGNPLKYGTVCIICDMVSFKDKLQKTPQKFHFYPYLRNRNIPRKTISYEDYFISIANPPVFDIAIDEYIDTSKQYSIYAIGAQGTKLTKWSAKTLSGFFGEVQRAIMFQPVEELNKHCDVVLN